MPLSSGCKSSFAGRMGEDAPANHPKYSDGCFHKTMNINEAVSWPLVREPRASGTSATNDLNRTLGLETHTFTHCGDCEGQSSFYSGHVDEPIRDLERLLYFPV